MSSYTVFPEKSETVEHGIGPKLNPPIPHQVIDQMEGSVATLDDVTEIDCGTFRFAL